MVGSLPIELVICDCDGTLVDSLFAITETFRLAAADCGLPAVAVETVGRYVGLPLDALFRDLLPHVDGVARQGLEARYRELYPRVAAGRTPLFPGTRAALEQLQGRGLRLAMATGKSLAGVERFLAEEGFETTFEAVRCADTAARPKPYPDMVAELLAETGVAPAAALMVGDTPFDLEMGHTAGVATCAVATGGFTAAELARQRPAMLLRSFADLPGILPLG